MGKFLLNPMRSLAGLVVFGMLFGVAHQSGTLSLFSGPAQRSRPVPIALADAVEDMCARVPTTLPEPRRVLQPLLLLGPAQDRESLVGDRLREAVNAQGWYRTVEKNMLENIIETTRELSGMTSDFSDRVMSLTPGELAALMRSAKAEVLMRGTLERLSLPRDKKPEIVLRLELWEPSPADPDTAVRLFSRTFSTDDDPSVDDTADGAAESPRPVAFSQSAYPYWIMLVLGLIWSPAMIPRMQAALREDDNTANLKAILGITSVPVLVFVVFQVFAGVDWMPLCFQSLVVALVVFFYTAFIMSRLRR